MDKSDYMLLAFLGVIAFAIYVTTSGWPLLALGLIHYKSNSVEKPEESE